MASRKKGSGALKSAGRKRGTVVLSRQREQKRKPRSKSARRKKAAARANWTTLGNANDRLLALDVSSKAVGWALFEKGALRRCGKYEHVGDGHGEKLYNYLGWLRTQFDLFKPHTVAVEAPFQGRHRYAFAVLTLYRAALLVAHFREFKADMPDENQIPAHLIKRVLDVPKGTHTENKANVVAVINELYGLSLRFDPEHPDNKKTNDDDIADAIAVGHAWGLLLTKEEV